MCYPEIAFYVLTLYWTLAGLCHLLSLFPGPPDGGMPHKEQTYKHTPQHCQISAVVVEICTICSDGTEGTA